MDRDQLCQSLITWVKTFSVEAPCSNVEDYSDGAVMAQVLHQIDPDYFNDSWLSKIRTEDVTNWRLKVSNLKKILKGILEYNVEILGVQIQGFQMPDVNAIGEHNNPTELGRLLQLILGCAVNCKAKQGYIERIMAMEEAVQQMIMNAIQELMTKEIPTGAGHDSELAEQLQKTSEELNNTIEAKEELLQRCHELDMQVASLLDEKILLVGENERLSEQLNRAECFDDPSTPAGKRVTQLQHQMEHLQEEVYKLETAKDDFRIKYEVLNKDYTDQKEKNAELAVLADEARSLKDELDILRHTSDQVTKYESTIESYKKKVEELSDLRGQIKLLEEKNTKYLQQQIELEEEARKVAALKQQLETYKRQCHELQNKSTEETKRADKAEFEMKRAQEKMATLQREKERIVTERDSLREMNDELKCSQHLASDLVDGKSELLALGSGSQELLSLPHEIKEKLLRLEHENKMLKMGMAGSQEEQSQTLQSLLDDANARKNELETEVRIANQRCMELEAQVEDMRASETDASNTEAASLRKQLSQMRLTMEEERTRMAQGQRQIGELEERLRLSAQQQDELQETINRKDDEMKKMEENYKRYLEKAKTIIKSLDTKESGALMPEVQALRNQLQEKERYIEHLEKENEKAKATRENEERLIVSAWYNLGMQLHRQAAEERLANSSMGHSFLARQRQFATRRSPTVPNAHANANSVIAHRTTDT